MHVLQVTREEFRALMKGELSGHDPMEAVLAVFAALSRPFALSYEPSEADGITLSKLRSACHDFEVCLYFLVQFTPTISSCVHAHDASMCP